MGKIPKRKAFSGVDFNIIMVFWVITSQNRGYKIKLWLASARHRLYMRNSEALTKSLSFCVSLSRSVIRRSTTHLHERRIRIPLGNRSEPVTNSPAHRIRSCLVFPLTFIDLSLSSPIIHRIVIVSVTQLRNF